MILSFLSLTERAPFLEQLASVQWLNFTAAVGIFTWAYFFARLDIRGFDG